MNNEKTLEWIADIFETTKDKIHPDLNRNEIEAWDSLGTLTLMARLDEDFDIRLSENELAGLNKIEDIIEILKQNNKISDI